MTAENCDAKDGELRSLGKNFRISKFEKKLRKVGESSKREISCGEQQNFLKIIMMKLIRNFDRSACVIVMGGSTQKK